MPRKARTPRQKPEHPHARTTEEAADYLGMSGPWLRLQRRLGRGPAYVKFGPSIRYLDPDLDEYLQAHRRAPGAA